MKNIVAFAVSLFFVILSYAADATDYDNRPKPQSHPTPAPKDPPKDNSKLRKAEVNSVVKDTLNAAEPGNFKVPPIDKSFLPGAGGHNPGQAVESK